MTQDDRELLVRIDERVGRIERHILGNGQPGLCTIQGGRITALEAWKQRTDGVLKFMAWLLGIVLAGGAIWAAVR